MDIIIYVVLTAIAVSLLTLLLARRGKANLERRLAVEEERGSRIPGLERALEGRAEQVINLRASLAKLQETLDQERRQADEKVTFLSNTKEQMTLQFKLLATDVMQQQGKQSKEQIETVLNPLRDKITDFQQSIQATHVESTKTNATLAQQIKTLTERSVAMTAETSNLTRALKGDTQMQGAWGEMILDRVLESSGLREGDEYETQQSHDTEQGRIRTDVEVKLPGGKRIVIDSKLSLVAFEEYVNAETDTDKANALARHVLSVRAHINILSAKNYSAAVGDDLDYVIMFCPIEGALAAALHGDSNLTAFAIDKNVVIGTPTTLMAMLRTVNNIWQVERRNRNAEEIADRAGKLYETVVGFVTDMTDLGNRLRQAGSSYDDAMKKLSSGNGNVVCQVEQLKDLGAKTNKSLPPNLTNGGETRLLS